MRLFATRIWLAASVIVTCALVAFTDEVLPRFKWGQTLDKVFVTIAVRKLDPSTVRLAFTDYTLSFDASDMAGQAYSLRLELANDIVAEGSHWEKLKRPDRWGDAVLATLEKRFPASWEDFVTDAGQYRKVIDRDWTREDQNLEIPEDDLYFSEHQKYLQVLAMEGLDKARSGVDALVINVRHAGCKQCSTAADDTFAKVAKNISDAKAGSWKKRLRLALVDARSERRLARLLGAKCAQVPQDCRLFVFGPHDAGGDLPVSIRARHNQDSLLADLQRLCRKQFVNTTASSAREGRASAKRGLVVLAPGAPLEVRQAAHSVRLRSDVAIAETETEAVALGLGTAGEAPWLLAWPPGEVEPSLFSGPFNTLESWLRARAVALLTDTSTFEEDEAYEELRLPIARLFLNGSSIDEQARGVVSEIARAFLGRVAFMVRNATAKAHEWRQHGLPPGHFPAFAVASSMAYNATRFAFLGVPSNGSHEFWSGSARVSLTAFLEEALSGRLERSIMSEAPPEEEGSGEAGGGIVKKLVGRRCRMLIEESETEALVEGYDEWRRDHSKRTKFLDALAPYLAAVNITTYRLDFGYNECPEGALPVLSAGYSGYFFVPRRARERRKTWQRLKKLDPPYERVLGFVKKHSEAKRELDASAILLEINATLERLDRFESMQAWASTPLVLTSIVAGSVGVLAFLGLRRRLIQLGA